MATIVALSNRKELADHYISEGDSMFSIQLHSVASVFLTALATFVPLDDPLEPNTQCGDDPASFSASSASAPGNDYGSQEDANDEAVDNLKAQLGADSGVICAICSTGLQCERKVRGLETENIVVTPGPIVDGKFTATATYSGPYIVKCKVCLGGTVGGGP